MYNYLPKQPLSREKPKKPPSPLRELSSPLLIYFVNLLQRASAARRLSLTHTHTHCVGGLREEKFELGPINRTQILLLIIQQILFFLTDRKYVYICL